MAIFQLRISIYKSLFFSRIFSMLKVLVAKYINCDVLTFLICSRYQIKQYILTTEGTEIMYEIYTV